METQGLAGEVVNLGNPTEITIREFAEIVVELTNARSELRYESLPTDDPTRRQPDIAKARRLLGWEPTVDLRTGLQRTLEYFAHSLDLATEHRPPLS
jgi:nucleoside-diphosphate-sugar epimerase